MNQIRIISDIHSYYHKYLSIIDNCSHSIQVGDFDFDYSPFMSEVDTESHVMFPGNHDNYDTVYDYSGCLGDFGEFELNNIRGFFIRGAFSIDWAYRTKTELTQGFKSYWTNEQLSYQEMMKALDQYKQVKPDFMLSHSCPISISRKLGNSKILTKFGYNPKVFTTNTQELLQECFDYYQPKLWIFGHFHQNWDYTYKGTRFICREPLSYCDVNQDYSVEFQK